MADLFDARGIRIEPGDTVIYGFGVGQSVAMAEGVVLGERRVALTPSGRVKVKIVRRSYGSGQKPVVGVQADRLVVLKQYAGADPGAAPHLPPSPFPTQDETVRRNILESIESYEADLKLTEVPAWWKQSGDTSLEAFHEYAGKRLAGYRTRLEALDG